MGHEYPLVTFFTVKLVVTAENVLNPSVGGGIKTYNLTMIFCMALYPKEAGGSQDRLRAKIEQNLSYLILKHKGTNQNTNSNSHLKPGPMVKSSISRVICKMKLKGEPNVLGKG
jgi:hypothetical protein